jgi:hypothetical protein
MNNPGGDADDRIPGKTPMAEMQNFALRAFPSGQALNHQLLKGFYLYASITSDGNNIC